MPNEILQSSKHPDVTYELRQVDDFTWAGLGFGTVWGKELCIVSGVSGSRANVIRLMDRKLRRGQIRFARTEEK